jgi:hypothetical protein
MNETIKSKMTEFGSKLPIIVENIITETPCNYTYHESRYKLILSFMNISEEEILISQNILNESFLKYSFWEHNGMPQIQKCYIIQLNEAVLKNELKNINDLANECENDAIYCKNKSYNFLSCKDIIVSVPTIRVGTELAIVSSGCDNRGNGFVALMNNNTDNLDTTKLSWLLNGKSMPALLCSPAVLYAGKEANCAFNQSYGIFAGTFTIIAIGQKNDAVGTINCPY